MCEMVSKTRIITVGSVRTCANSLWYCSISAASTWTSAGARAGAATNSSEGLLRQWMGQRTLRRNICAKTHPTSFLASHRKGFSKL